MKKVSGVIWTLLLLVVLFISACSNDSGYYQVMENKTDTLVTYYFYGLAETDFRDTIRVEADAAVMLRGFTSEDSWRDLPDCAIAADSVKIVYADTSKVVTIDPMVENDWEVELKEGRRGTARKTCFFVLRNEDLQ